MIPPEVVNLPCSQVFHKVRWIMQRWFSTADITMRSRKTEIYGGLRGCIQKVIHFMHKVIPRYPVESPVDKVDSQFLRQIFTAVSCGAGMRAKTWLGGSPYPRRWAQGWTPRFPPLRIPFPLFLIWRKSESGDCSEKGNDRGFFLPHGRALRAMYPHIRRVGYISAT